MVLNVSARIESLNDNMNRVDYDPDAPRRIVIMFQHGTKRYACKIAPAWSMRHAREIQIYQTLNRPKRSASYAFDPARVVRLVDQGTVPVSIEKPYPSMLDIPIKVGGAKSAIRLVGSMLKSFLDAVSLKVDRNEVNANRSSLPMLYFVTEADASYRELFEWKSGRKKLPADVHKVVLEETFYAIAKPIIHAHLTFGFSHWDLHTRNVLVSYRVRGTPISSWHELPKTVDGFRKDAKVLVKLFDFDLSYLPTPPPKPPSSVAMYALDADANMWLTTALQQQWVPSVKTSKSKRQYRNTWSRFGPVHDLARLMMMCLDQKDQEQRKRARYFVTQLYPRGFRVLGRLFDWAEETLQRYPDAHDMFDYYRFFDGEIQKKRVPPLLFPPSKIPRSKELYQTAPLAPERKNVTPTNRSPRSPLS